MFMATTANDSDRFPTDYDEYASTYAWARSAVPWVLERLQVFISHVPRGAAVLEIGCGTGNYIGELSGRQAQLRPVGLDRSKPMLDQALSAAPQASYVAADAAVDFPFADQAFSFEFAVDVIQHIDDLRRFFTEAHRVLEASGSLIVVTDSEATLRRRSLTVHFPEILPTELIRYPALSLLHREAAWAGFQLVSHTPAVGEIPLNADFMERLEAKCSSAMRLMSPADHAAGMARVRAARARGESWLSYYDVLHYARPDETAA